jgi:hypothetical protein
MKKAELLENIEALERRIQALEACEVMRTPRYVRPMWPEIPVPMPWDCKQQYGIFCSQPGVIIK